MGLLTERAAKTLLYYFSETNVTAHAWFAAYLRACEIPRVRVAARSSGLRALCSGLLQTMSPRAHVFKP